MRLEGSKFILTSFILWRIALFLIVFLGIALFPLQKDFLGGGLTNYVQNPYFWSFLNFDGEHYAAIAHLGYQPLTYFFFPLLPILTRLIAFLVSSEFITIARSGLLVSNLAFLIGLFGLWKLIRLDYKENIAKMTLLLLILFPTSFYFGAFYTEGLVFALIIWSFFFARKGSWIFAGVLGAFATATRITALALIPALGYEVWKFLKHRKSSWVVPLISLALVPLGLILYMYYLYVTVGDPLEFFHNVSIFGEQRSSEIILLPQVFYRYFFKVLPNLNYNYFPIVFTTYLEIASGIIFGILGIWSFFKLRLSYSLFFAVGYLIPPLSGSFSSFPRYVLILFPAFLLSALWLNKKPRELKIAVYCISGVLLALACALFIRGYWVS